MVVGSDEIIACLNAGKPVPLKLLEFMEKEITRYDCEEWDAKLGRAIVAFLRNYAKKDDTDGA